MGHVVEACKSSKHLLPSTDGDASRTLGPLVAVGRWPCVAVADGLMVANAAMRHIYGLMVACGFCLVMAALRSRCRHYTFALSFLSFFFFSSHNLSGRILDVYHTSTHGEEPKSGLSANLECRSEMCCTRLAGNTGRKTVPSGYYRTTLSSSQIRHVWTIGGKFVKQQYRIHMSSQYGELRPTNG